MNNSHGRNVDWINDLTADTELTLRFPGDPHRPGRQGDQRNSNIGWPPVRGRRNKSGEEESLDFPRNSHRTVKVAVDGAPFMRKVDLGVFTTYEDLFRALLEMFSSCFTNIPTTTRVKEEDRIVVNGIEYIPTYEDKDGDWMLLGDVPWEMFKQSCKRIRLVKS